MKLINKAFFLFCSVLYQEILPPVYLFQTVLLLFQGNCPTRTIFPDRTFIPDSRVHTVLAIQDFHLASYILRIWRLGVRRQMKITHRYALEAKLSNPPPPVFFREDISTCKHIRHQLMLTEYSFQDNIQDQKSIQRMILWIEVAMAKQNCRRFLNPKFEY